MQILRSTCFILKFAAFGVFPRSRSSAGFKECGIQPARWHSCATQKGQSTMTAVDYGILQTDPSSADVTWHCPPGFRVVLGSQSSTRRTILSEMKVQFECMSPNIDEKAIRMEKPEDLVLALARAKAQALMIDKRLAEASASGGTTLLLTCDQVRRVRSIQFHSRYQHSPDPFPGGCPRQPDPRKAREQRSSS